METDISEQYKRLARKVKDMGVFSALCGVGCLIVAAINQQTPLAFFILPGISFLGIGLVLIAE